MEDEEQLDDSSDLFDSVLGGMTDEQWEEYRIQKRLESDFVVDIESDEEEMYLDENTSSSSQMLDEVVTHIEVVREEDEVAIVDPDEELDAVSKVSWDSDAAVRYVNGEISFTELSEIIEGQNKSRKRKATGELIEVGTNEDVESEPKTGKHIKKKKQRRRVYQLPKDLQGLMGTANMCFAKGDADEAIRICLELIRQAPSCQEPYQTLGMIYEETGDMKKSLQCSLLAAYLNPSDTEEWIRLAGLSLEQSQIPQAIRCYTFAIRNDPTNINFLWERCNLYEVVGDRKNALAGYELILKNLSNPEDGEKCVEIAREIAKVHHSNEDFTNAIKILETAFSKFPSLVTSEDVNLLLELQLSQKCYKAAIKNAIQHCGVSLHMAAKEVTNYEEVDNFDDDQIKEIEWCNVPEVLPIDIQAKLLICLIHLRLLETTKDLLHRLKQENPNSVGDLYLDVAEAFMEINEPNYAEPLLRDLISSENYNLAAVWLKYGDCLNMLLNGKEATKAYETVLRMVPSYQEARMSLSKILVECGKKEEAVTVLKQEYEGGKEDAVIDLKVLIERCNHLYDLEMFEEFIKAATLAQYSHCYKLETEEEYIIVVNNLHNRKKFEVLRDLSSIAERPKPNFLNTDVPSETMWIVFHKLCRKLFELKRFRSLQDVALDAITSSRWKRCDDYLKGINILVLLACMYNRNNRLSYTLIRDLIIRDVNKNRLWNLLDLNLIYSQQIRHARFCFRYMLKFPDHLALGLFNGHNAMNSGSYKHALAEYVTLLKKRPNDPELLFYIGITYTHMASQKFATKRPLLVAQAVAFLQKYMEARKESQESLYNMGRAMHQLGIKDVAVMYYKRALDVPAVLLPDSQSELFDLKQEIAFNLALIYESSGANDLASMYLRTYSVV